MDRPEIRSNLGSHTSNHHLPCYMAGRENWPPAMFFLAIEPGRAMSCLVVSPRSCIHVESSGHALPPAIPSNLLLKMAPNNVPVDFDTFKHGGFTTKITESPANPGFIKISIITSQYLAIILRINPHSIRTKSKVFDSFWRWIPYKHNNISWTHSNNPTFLPLFAWWIPSKLP